MAAVSAATVAAGIAERLRDDAVGHGGYVKRLTDEIARLNLQGETTTATALGTYLTSAKAGTGNAGARGIA